MNKIWMIIIGIAIFLIINFLYYKSMKGYVKESFGKKWLNVWGNKVWFWQSSIFVSTGGTVLVMYLLKWSNVLTF
jgi:dTDP-4-dehydrorhamnose 3,5-epimerase-like enzyme